MVTVSIVIPTYRRIADLVKCLEGIDSQTRQPKEVVVVCRDTDEISLATVGDWLSTAAPYRKKRAIVSEPGMLAAMKAGAAEATGDVIAFTDDDAIPRPAWIERMAAAYEDERVGGVGGRDIQQGQAQAAPGTVVGIVTWYGKLHGNHHIGAGGPRKVDVLKGVNMSFRRSLLRFPERLQGSGAQVHIEVHICLHVRKQGYFLIYDPNIEVDHFPAVRFDADQRGKIVPEAVRNAAYNLHVGILRQGGGPIRTPARILYATLVGDRRAPGLFRTGYGLVRGEREVLRAFWPAQAGTWQGLLQLFKTSKTRRLDRA
ncbi:glycosyltransferase family 2 protein [Cohnella sp. GbtcB17]|uniref:glycosyltransferase family 2 protein n=1 Tax=Cohnella sp. GbtcB17 TaxID=2824762 RepID=UPI001C307701|nr:glycosyltransferase [Cohnella sp. GbtcB17]